MRKRAGLVYLLSGAMAFCVFFAPVPAFGLAESTAPEGSNAQAVHALGETGTGVNVALIAAGNNNVTHEAFRDPCSVSHAFNYDSTGDGFFTRSHDTWMAGIIASRGGESFPNDIGVAPGVDIHTARVRDDEYYIYFSYVADALDELVNHRGCRVVVSGIALDPSFVTPDGQSSWTMLYDYYAYEHDLVFANAAGNNGSEIAVFGDAYNGITTGGLIVTDPDVYRRVGSVSASGPTGDTRRKPELAAPSQNQTMPSAGTDTTWHTYTEADGATSFSCPHTAGVAALLLGLADTTAEPDDHHHEVIKAVVVNSAFPNIDTKTGTSTAGSVFDYDRGYGRIDALRAYQTLQADKISTAGVITAEKGWAFDTIAGQGEHVYTVNAAKNYRLLITLTWDRRTRWLDSPPKNNIIDPDELSAYYANLDLVVYEPDMSVIFSEAHDGLNPDDNLEKCDLLLNTDGDYTVKVVNNSATENPRYGLAFELLEPIVGDFDLNYIVNNNDLAFFAGQWLQLGSGLEADLWRDGIVNPFDLAIFAHYWLQIDERYHSN